MFLPYAGKRQSCFEHSSHFEIRREIPFTQSTHSQFEIIARDELFSAPPSSKKLKVFLEKPKVIIES